MLETPQRLEARITASATDPISDSGDAEEAEVTDFILDYVSTIKLETPTNVSLDASRSLMRPSTRCFGYQEGLSRADDTQKRQRLVQDVDSASIARAPSTFLRGMSDLEVHCFSYFRHCTGPQFASYFDSTMWEAYSANLALSHPVTFACATALGAVHRRFGYGISREAFEYCAHSFKLYARAKFLLAELKVKMAERVIDQEQEGSNVDNRDVVMLSEMLLGLFEGFQANYDSAVRHMNEGMRYMLNRPMKLLHSENMYCNILPTNPEIFARFWRRIQERARRLFDSEANLLEPKVPNDGLMTLPPVPDQFATFEQARDMIFTDVHLLMHTPKHVWRNEYLRGKAQKLHVNRLLRWSVAYAETVKNMHRTNLQKQQCMLLKLTKNMAYLLLYLILYVNVYVHGHLVDQERSALLRKSMADGNSEVEDFLETCIQNGEMAEDTKDFDDDEATAYAMPHLWNTISRREELLSNLCRVQILGEAILDPDSIFSYLEHSCSFDSAIGPPISPQLEPEASGKTRHLVKNLIETPDKEDLYERLDVYGVAERISALEEHAVIDAVRDKIPSHINPRWVDVTCLLEQGRLLLRYCSPDEYGQGMRWTQEWWSMR